MFKIFIYYIMPKSPDNTLIYYVVAGVLIVIVVALL